MGITITSLGIGHPVTNITTTTTVQDGFATSNTTSSEEFEAGVNRWGQAGAKIEFYNEDERDIKYVDFQLVPYNNVGDVVGGIGSVCTVRATGPFKSHRRASVKWNYIWDGFSIKTMGIVETRITYMDGSTETVEGFKQQYDGAMGKGYALPIFLMLCSIICYIGCFTSGKSLFMGQTIKTSISFVLMLAFPLLGLIFSRKKDRRLATLFSALNVVSCIIFCIILRKLMGSLLLSGFRRWNHIVLWPVSSLVCPLMSVIPLLRATGAGSFKKYAASELIANCSNIGVCILFTILAVIDAINFQARDFGALMATYMLFPLYCAYLSTISNRYRSL